MNKSLKKILIIFLASYFIYRFYFNFISSALQQLMLFGFLGAYGLFSYHRLLSYFQNLGRFKTLFITIIIMHVSIIAATFFVPIVYGTGDLTLFTSNLRSFSYTISYFVLIDIIKVQLNPINLKDEFMKVFIYSSTLYVGFSIVALIFPGLRSFWLSIIHESERNLHLLRNNPSYIARFGWTGFSSFVITFFISIAILFSLYLLIKGLNKDFKLRKKYLVTTFLLLIGNSFYGRVGLFNSLALIVFVIVYIIVKSTKKHYAVFLVGGAGFSFMLFSIVQNFIPQMQQWYNWIMDPIINLLTTGQLNTTSTDHLFSMYFIPNIRTLLFGDGFYAGTQGNSYYMSVDVGYLRPLLFYGVFFLILNYGVTILLSSGLSKGKKENKFLSFMLIFSLFLFEVKGEVGLTLIPILYTLFIAEIDVRKNNANEKGENELQLHSSDQLIQSYEIESAHNH